MKVIITGGAGFLGLQLARRLTALGSLTGPSGKPEKIDELLLFDVVTPDKRPAGLDDRAKFVAGEIADKATVRKLFDRPDLSVFHLASVVSGGGEQDFDLAMRVNLNGNLHVLESARALGSKPRVVFASSIAVFGGKAMPKHVGDATKQVPQTTYGMTKAIGELLVNDYTPLAKLDAALFGLPGRMMTAAARRACRPSSSGPASRTRQHRASPAACSASRSMASNARCPSATRL